MSAKNPGPFDGPCPFLDAEPDPLEVCAAPACDCVEPCAAFDPATRSAAQRVEPPKAEPVEPPL